MIRGSALTGVLLLALNGPLAAGNGAWTSGGPEGGEVTSVVVDPSAALTVYAGTRLNGVFKSADGGVTWSPASSGLERRIGALAIGPDGVLYAIAGNPASGVFKSVDGGASWSELLDLAANCVAVDPTSSSVVYLGTTAEGVYKSVDGGASWSSSTSGLFEVAVEALAIDPGTTSVLYAATSAVGVYKSADGGATWTSSNDQIDDVSVAVVVIDPVTPSTLYAGARFEGVFESTDSGATWSEASSGLPTTTVSALTLDPTSPSTLFAGLAGRIYQSTDGAASWSELPLGLIGVDILSLVVDPVSSARVFAGTGAGLSRSTDGGASWSESNVGLRAMFIDRIVGDPAMPSTLYAASPVSGVFKSVDGGASWQGVNGGFTDRAITDLAISESQSTTLYAATIEDVYTTTDGGQSWASAVADPADFGLFGQRVTALGVDPASALVVYAGNSGPPIGQVGAGIYQTSNGGTDWSSIHDPDEALTAFKPTGVAIGPSDPSRLLLGALTASTPFGLPLDYQILRSPDGGTSWTEVLAGEDRSGIDLLGDPTVADRVFVAVTGDGFGRDGAYDLFRSLDGGSTWSPLAPGSPCLFSLAADPTVAGTIYLGCEPVYVSTDGGDSWTPFDDTGFPVASGGARELTLVETSPPTLHAGTFGGVYSYTLPPRADLVVTKDDGLTEVEPGSGLTYVVGVENSGPDEAPSAGVNDALPVGLSCTWSCVAAGGGICTPAPPDGDLDDTVSLPAGATLTYTADCELDEAAAGMLLNTATASVATGTVDPVSTNDSASDATVVLTPGACGAFENRAVSDWLIDTAEEIEACTSIVLGPGIQVRAPGSLVLRAGEWIGLADGVAIGDGATITVHLELPGSPLVAAGQEER